MSTNPDARQDSRDASRNASEMDRVLAQTLSMDAEPFRNSTNYNLLTGDDTLGDDPIWHNLGLSSSSQGHPNASLFDPFPLPTVNPLGIGTSNMSFPLAPPTPLNLQSSLVPSSVNQIQVSDDADNNSGISNWIKHPSQAAGYIEGRDCDVLASIKASKNPKPAKPYLLTDKNRKPELPLTKPSLDPTGNSDIVVVATSNHNARKHMVMALDMSLLQDNNSFEPESFIRGMALIRSYGRELHWISERCLVVAHGSEASIFDINDQYQMTERSKLNWAHTDEIREIAFNPKDRNAFAAGGFDKVLSINDLSRSMTTISAVRLDDVIGSVNWGSFDTQSVTMTTDDGRFFQFDPRTAMRKASLFVDAQKLHLYTHCVFDPNYVLLGFGDGEILQVDIRKNMFTQGTKDPFVHAIGDMVYHDGSRSFLISGQPDFSVWRYDPSKSAALAWSRPNVNSVHANMYCHAIYGRRSDIIIKTNELGLVGLYRHVNLV